MTPRVTVRSSLLLISLLAAVGLLLLPALADAKSDNAAQGKGKENAPGQVKKDNPDLNANDLAGKENAPGQVKKDDQPAAEDGTCQESATTPGNGKGKGKANAPGQNKDIVRVAVRGWVTEVNAETGLVSFWVEDSIEGGEVIVWKKVFLDTCGAELAIPDFNGDGVTDSSDLEPWLYPLELRFKHHKAELPNEFDTIKADSLTALDA